MLSKKTKPKFYCNHRSRQQRKELIKETYSSAKTITESLTNNNLNILEIGFGMGNSITQLYADNKQNYYCIESYLHGINNLNKFVISENTKNIYLLYGDGVEIIENGFPDKSLDEVLIFFPDPWPKSKHNKRRIINEYTISLIFNKLKKGGLFHFTTDHINYAYDVKSMLQHFFNKSIIFNSNRNNRPITNYEKRALKRKNFIFDINLIK